MTAGEPGNDVEAGNERWLHPERLERVLIHRSRYAEPDFHPRAAVAAGGAAATVLFVAAATDDEDEDDANGDAAGGCAVVGGSLISLAVPGIVVLLGRRRSPRVPHGRPRPPRRGA